MLSHLPSDPTLFGNICVPSFTCWSQEGLTEILLREFFSIACVPWITLSRWKFFLNYSWWVSASGHIPFPYELGVSRRLNSNVTAFLFPYFAWTHLPYWRRQWHPSPVTLAWKIPWTQEPRRLQSMGSLRVGHDWATSLSRFTFMHWRRKWQPTPVFLPGESQGGWSWVGCRLWGHTESDTTEVT